MGGDKTAATGIDSQDARRGATAATAPPSPTSSAASLSSTETARGTAVSKAATEAGEGQLDQLHCDTPVSVPGPMPISAPVSTGRRRKAGGSPSAPSPPTARVATVSGHKTVRLRPRVYEVPTLGFLCVQMLAEHSDRIVDLRGVGEEAARQLLREIMGRQKLTYPLAKVFMECGDDELSSALASLNLWDAIPAGRQGRHNRHL